MTVSLWERTSKRFTSMNEEMSAAAMLLNYRATTDFMDAVSYNNIEEYIEKVGPTVFPDTVIYKFIQNKKHFQLRINETTRFLESTEENDSLNSLLIGTNFTDRTLSRFVLENIGETNYDKLSLKVNPDIVYLLPGISIEGNAESRVGKLYLYATNKFKSNQMRYDFVQIQNTDGLQPAQVIVFLMRKVDDRNEFFAIVRFLRISHEKYQPNPMYNCPFTILEWEYTDNRTLTPFYDMVKIESISGPAFITPVFSSDINLPNCSKPSRSDKFWFIDRIYFDRAGWEDPQESRVVDNIDYNEYEIVVPNNINDGNIDLYNVDDNSDNDDSSNSGSEAYDEDDDDDF
jgi:hypothetical protein